MTQQFVLHHFETGTPLDPLHFVTRDGMLVALDFGPVEARLSRLLKRRFGDGFGFTPAAGGHPVRIALEAYLAGDLAALDAIAVDGGGTPFQKQVWKALRSIPPGETRSYGELAAILGQPTAARAVGLANGLNPINLFVPCHRVIGKSGALTGYGGGIERKRWLLAHEQAATRTVANTGQMDFSF